MIRDLPRLIRTDQEWLGTEYFLAGIHFQFCPKCMAFGLVSALRLEVRQVLWQLHSHLVQRINHQV